ncbi:Sister chromatid cohesion protein [Nesidiocoris tenuis]|uniref:Sister chromatid cohesion protein DCC1 n=1 Tax=Nesidiocoris tenuis TaxID=355587 RepID=A0ABN7A4Y4_9HEMI|nr:Sister chromatid cohesion protein [Nesidiocoris tenuis]
MEVDIEVHPEGAAYERTLEDVNSVINHAKLSRADLKSTSQVLYFSSDFPNYKLLECDQTILQHLTAGQELYIRGRPSDRAVVCTKDNTFDLREAETSNSLLLVPGLKMVDELDLVNNENSAEGRIEKKSIVGVYHEYFELKKVRPLLNRLRIMLMSKPYSGPENENTNQEGENGQNRDDLKTYSFEELLEEVQASEKELTGFLKELEAVEIDGKWRILDHEYQFRALSFLLNFVDEQSWPPDAIPIGETTSTLKGLLPDSILYHILQVYLVETENESDDSDLLFELNENKICRFLGEALLRPVDKFNLHDFLQAWESSVPSGLETNLKQLDGLALHDTKTNPPVIWYFPESKLSEDIAERIAQLFAERRQWTFDEIEPYIAPLTTEKQTVNALLTKHARSSNIGGQKLYSARHGK